MADMALNKSCMEVCPPNTEETREGALTSKRHIMDVKDHGMSHPGNLTEAEGSTISKMDTKTDSLVSSSISILTSDRVSGPRQEHNQQSKRTPSSTPEALKRRSCTKVYPLDSVDNEGLLFPDGLDLGFEQEMRDTYPELFGDMDPDGFLSYDLEMMNEDDSVEIMSSLLWDDLEEGEIPSA
uniref:Uncharacterized protein n=1 Tax=Arundo donax TaxID=35708 RepID=A0A0A9E3L2_ARUDO